MKTYVAIILDKSGSMGVTKNATIAGFNEQIQQLKEDAKTQEIYCSLISFNGEVYEHLWNVSADQLTEANSEDYNPNGSTAMRDAVGYTVQKLINTTDHENPENAYLIITISDGDTNMDKHYQINSLKELTESCQNTKRWTFTYIGCDEQYLKEIAAQTSTPISNMAAWDNSNSGNALRGFSNSTSRQKKYFAERKMGQVGTANFASDLDCMVADYTSDMVESAAAPVVVSLADLPQVDLNSILDRTPKYVNQIGSASYTGESLFENSQKVEWENK